MSRQIHLDDLDRWSKQSLIAEVRRLRRRLKNDPTGRQVAPRPASFAALQLVTGFLFGSEGRPGPPLWYCRTCGISVGEWNPALEPAPLYCPRCRGPLTIHGQRINSDGAITVTFEPIIEAPTGQPRLIEGPETKTITDP